MQGLKIDPSHLSFCVDININSWTRTTLNRDHELSGTHQREESKRAAATADEARTNLPLDVDALIERQELDLLIQNQLLTKSGARRTTTWRENLAYYVWCKYTP